MLLAGAAGHVVESRPAVRPPEARGAFWSARAGDGGVLRVDPEQGLVIGPGDSLQLVDLDAGAAAAAGATGSSALRRVVLSVERTGRQSSYVRIHFRQSDAGLYRAFVVPGASVTASLALERGGGSASLASNESGPPAGAAGQPFEVSLELDGPRMALALDGQVLVRAEDARLDGGRCTIWADGVRVHALQVEGRDAAGQPFTRRAAVADLAAAAPAAWRPMLVALAEAATLALAVAAFLRALCLARPRLSELAWAATVGLIPLAVLVAGRGLLHWTLPAPLVGLLAALGVAPALTALRARLKVGPGGALVGPAAAAAGGPAAPRERRRSLAVALVLVAAAAWTAGATRRDAVQALRADELTAARAASSKDFSAEGPQRLDASSALLIPEPHRSFVLSATVTLEESSWLELRFRERTGASQGVALFLGSDERMRTGFVEEGAVTFQPIGSGSGPLPAGRPLRLELEASDSHYEARIDGEPIAQADERRHPVGRSAILAVDGAATVADLRLDAADVEPPVRGPAREVLAAAAVPVALAFLLALLCGRYLTVPGIRAPELAAWALVPLLFVGRAAEVAGAGGSSGLDGFSHAPSFALGVAGALGVLGVLVMAHGRGARSLLLLLPAAVLLPLGLAKTAGPPLSRAEASGQGWAWIGVPRLEPGLVHVQHPMLREWNDYLDAHRLRGKRFAIPKPAGTVRVVCLGTSSTWGHGIEESSGLDYPSILGDLLRERLPGVPLEAVNAGVSGASTPRLLYFLREVLLDLEPDLVVLSVSYNDATFLTRFDEQAWLERLSAPGAGVGLLERLAAARDADRGLERAARFEARRTPSGGDSLAAWHAAVGDGPTPLDRFERALHDVADLLQGAGIPLVLVKEAQRGDEHRAWKAEFYAVIDRIAEGHGARVVDPKPALDAAGGAALFIDPVHLNPRGNRVQAGAIAPVVEELVRARRP